ncbi:putative Ig domain-containing protein [Rhodoferax sp.]|uniref:putative Ig domain-containing protein n=1 Tax=Rhodoferax sp. TaxID=50421 RepID=UPI00284FD1D5|nr:putative Ig domain-containing protein [Rhodoferax sp.]MDR3369484.1 putative Ig domain-containing protein [Rhodoferax sp.]
MAAPLASGTTTLQIDMATLPVEVAAQLVQPAFHMAPVLLDTPDDADSSGDELSAHRHPHRHALPANSEGISTRQLTPQLLEAAQREHRRGSHHAVLDITSPDGVITPMATSSSVLTYSPAQIRAAYGLSALPAAGANLNTTQAAQLGAGQTIYIVDAKHNPNVAAELAAFNQKFGLPTCTTQSIAASSKLPLSSAPVTGCQLSIVYNTAAGAMTSAAPAYDSGWATEISLDVQWAHATAPMARIILIEAADASINNLLGGVLLANAMGPGAVSMSFGSMEGSWTSSVDSAFAASNMTYLAATGDSGAAVSWPAVSAKVVAVGGTSLTYSGTGTRSETTWSGTGGGTSLYTLKPTYQTNAVPGMGSYSGRAVADVAFNADPATGQYVAVMAPGSTAVSWISAGGTSLATPQWAGLIAIANASRALSAKSALGTPHAVLYNQIATVPGTYANVFADITKGMNGTCAVCVSGIGYDIPSGLGTPNVSSLVNTLSGVINTASAPVVSSASVSGQVGTALTFTASVTAPNAVTYTLTGAPSGMSISTAGIVSWATPVAGSYSVTVTAKDSKTGLSGQGVYTVTIAAAAPPVVGSATISGKVGTTLSFVATATSANAVTYTLTGAPSGMTVSTTGIVSWAAPVAGSYSVTVTAKDSKTGLSGKGIYTVVIAAQLPPTVAAATVNGKPAVALSFTVSVSAPNPVTYGLTGAPSGMSISSTGVVSWAKPVLGTYNVTVVAKDSKTGLSGQGVTTVKIANAGPVITAPATTGVVGKILRGSITIADPGATSLSISISGAPLGMSFSASGQTISYVWNSPVVGSYNLKVSVVDSAGLTSQTTVPVTVTAK